MVNEIMRSAVWTSGRSNPVSGTDIREWCFPSYTFNSKAGHFVSRYDSYMLQRHKWKRMNVAFALHLRSMAEGRTPEIEKHTMTTRFTVWWIERKGWACMTDSYRRWL